MLLLSESYKCFETFWECWKWIKGTRTNVVLKLEFQMFQCHWLMDGPKISTHSLIQQQQRHQRQYQQQHWQISNPKFSTHSLTQQ